MNYDLNNIITMTDAKMEKLPLHCLKKIKEYYKTQLGYLNETLENMEGLGGLTEDGSYSAYEVTQDEIDFIEGEIRKIEAILERKE